MTTTAERQLAPFRNEAIRDFKDPQDRTSLEAALGRARAKLGTRYPLVIDGKKIETTQTIRSMNPA
ncbi:MAG: L-glutamate gamma-semialdehyde dehydrogenase, partial [Candidatus Eremiobacteraeota bacterium]|nr:L-glutamate gamma-semialdehyde dehydrogenase [Candidatus Eremiobacteraeota bacterium]